MKKTMLYALTTVLALIVPLFVPAQEARGADIAGASARRAMPDLLGFRLGMTLPEVLAHAASLKLTVQQAPNDGRTSIAGLPDSEYRPQVTLINVGPQGVFTLHFNAPPGESRLTSATRGVDYQKHAPNAAPSAAELKAALIEKFGTPTKIDHPAGHDRMKWLWAADGRLQTKGQGTPCDLLAAPRGSVMVPPNPQQEKIIKDGCALSVEAIVKFAASGVVETLNQQAVDVAGRFRAGRATYQAVQDHARKQNEKDLQRAKQRKPAL